MFARLPHSGHVLGSKLWFATPRGGSCCLDMLCIRLACRKSHKCRCRHFVCPPWGICFVFKSHLSHSSTLPLLALQRLPQPLGNLSRSHDLNAKWNSHFMACVCECVGALSVFGMHLLVCDCVLCDSWREIKVSSWYLQQNNSVDTLTFLLLVARRNIYFQKTSYPLV